MTPRPYYVGYGRYEPAMAQADCISNKPDDAWIIGPHKIDTVACKYDTNIFLVNDVSSSPPQSPFFPDETRAIVFFICLFYLFTLAKE